MRSSRPSPPFTLIELLVVVSIITVLASMLLPALSRSRAKAKAATCMSRLKQLHMGMTFYAEESDEWGMSIYWGSGQTIYAPAQVVHDYFPEISLLICPDTSSIALGNASYYPGRVTSTRTYMSYLMNFGTSTHSDASDLYGWHHYWYSTAANQYISPCPNLRMLGNPSVADIATPTQHYYIADASDQAMAMDPWNTRGTWGGYGLGTDIVNNHISLGNAHNIVYMDGHAEWKDIGSSMVRYRAFNNDYYY